MMYKLFWYVLSSPFLTGPWFYAKLPYFYDDIFPPYPFPPPFLLNFLTPRRLCKSLCRIHPSVFCLQYTLTFLNQEWERDARSGSKRKSFCGCVQNNSGMQFIVPISDQNPIPSLALCPTGSWLDNIHVLKVSTILQL